jgi:2-amino-4-hydroxy-6-hydroxymethyldihydropteridine diphosphokinase
VARVYVGLGSNISPEENLRLGIRELRWRYGSLDLSAVYSNAAVGFDGEDFLNMVVGFESDDAPGDILTQIEVIHGLAGRDRGSGRYTSRPLDIDLLLYDDEVIDDPRFRVPRPDILRHDFVLRPLAELAPDLEHPETGRRVADHWDDYDKEAHALQRVDLDF